MDSHTQRRTYYFQVRKCSDTNCRFHERLRGSSEILHFPKPVTYVKDENVQHYMERIDSDEKHPPPKFEDVLGSHQQPKQQKMWVSR